MHPNQGGPHAGQGQGPTVHHIRAQTRQDVGASTTHTAGASTTLLSCLHALAHRVSPSAACPPYRAASDHARVAQSLGASCASQRTGGTARLAGVPRIGQDRGRRWACRRDAGGGSTDSTTRKHASVDGSRAARKHAHPACAQAHKAASRPHHAPVGRSHPPLEATVSPVPAAVGRSSTGAPLPLIHDRPASRGTVRPHTCAGPKPVTCSHNPTLPPSPPRRPTAAPFAARGPATHHVPAAPVAMSAAPATASAVVPLLRRVATCRVLCRLRAGGAASSLLLLVRVASKRLHLVQCSSNRSVQQACGATLRRGHLGDRGLDHAIAVCGTV